MTAKLRPGLCDLSLCGIQSLDPDLPEGHRVVMARKAEKSGQAILAGMRRSIFELGDFAQISIQNRKAVQFDRDSRTANRDLLKVPLARRSEKTTMSRHHAVGRSVKLPRIELGEVEVRVVEHLQLAHSHQVRLSRAGVTNDQSVVAARRKLELQPRDEIGEFVHSEQVAALSRLCRRLRHA